MHNRRASFIELDRELLAERWQLEAWYQPRPLPNLPALVRAMRRSDLVFGWWANWHTFWAIAVARALGRPSVLVVGGFDTANLPEIGYGFQRGGVRRWASRWVMGRASRLITNSQYSLGEIERNVGLAPERVDVIHHGVHDLFGSLPGGEREPVALTVGVVDRVNLERKGLRAFVDAAALVPEVSFVVAGRWEGDAVEALRRAAPANVTFTGELAQEELEDRFRRAAVYVQASRHEGFGVAIAEAMLAGCVPVVAHAGALPEVVGDAGIVVDSTAPAELADAVRRALALDDGARRRARERVLSRFPVERRAQRLRAVVESALSEAATTGDGAGAAARRHTGTSSR